MLPGASTGRLVVHTGDCMNCPTTVMVVHDVDTETGPNNQ